MQSANEFERWLDQVEAQLDYRFSDRELLRQALTHTSFAHENGLSCHNEPLEFLGDAVLGLIVAERIVRVRRELSEGDMTRLRATLVNTRSLAREAMQMKLGQCLLLGKGEERSGGRTKPTILADAFEALLGAVLLDGGIRQTRKILHRLFAERIKDAKERSGHGTDAKTALQELLQARGRPLPEYRLIRQSGPDHERVFEVEVWVQSRQLGVGQGTSKKRAEQAAARHALEVLDEPS